MYNNLKNELVNKFPMTEKHAKMLIEKYGALAFEVSLKLYEEGFIFTMLDIVKIEDALNINSKFKNVVKTTLDLHEENLKNYRNY